MIELECNFEQYELNIDNPFLLKIISTYMAYGKTSFTDFWVQKINGKLTSCISRLDDSFTVHTFYETDNEADYKEISEFLNFFGKINILSDKKCMLNISGKNKKTGIVMLAFTSKYKELGTTTFVFKEDIKASYQVLRGCIDELYVPAFSDYYVDMSHKTRHGFAKSLCLIENGIPTATAIANAIYKNEAIITVAVSKPYRGRGYGTAVLRKFLASLYTSGITKAFIMREHGKNKDFYEKNKFVNVSEWQEINT